MRSNSLILLILITGLTSQTLAQLRIPVYLAIQTDTQQAEPMVHNFLGFYRQQLLNYFPNDQQTINNDFDQIENVFQTGKPYQDWKFSDSWHTTVLYIGKNYSLLNSSYYKDFQEGNNVQLTSQTIVYIPGKLICTPVFPYNVSIANPIPHISLILGNWSAVNSNDVLIALFGENGPLRQNYASLNSTDSELKQKIESINILGENVDAYVIKENSLKYPDQPFINITGVNTKIYFSGQKQFIRKFDSSTDQNQKISIN